MARDHLILITVLAAAALLAAADLARLAGGEPVHPAAPAAERLAADLGSRR